MDPLAHQVAERGVNLALPIDPAQTGEVGAFDGQREMALSPWVVAGVPDMLVALVLKVEAGGERAAVSRSIISLATGPVAATGIMPI